MPLVFFNFDTDFVTPSCLLPDWTYHAVWLFSFLLPIVFALLLCLTYGMRPEMLDRTVNCRSRLVETNRAATALILITGPICSVGSGYTASASVLGALKELQELLRLL